MKLMYSFVLVALVALLCIPSTSFSQGAPSRISAKAVVDQGKRLYEVNCKACHEASVVLVGPSLAEIAFLYRDNVKGIVDWAIKPVKKRSHMIPMPPMAFVGQEKLQKISRYILGAMKGKEKKDTSKGWKLSPPTGKIQRLLMPDSGPASIAVNLGQDLPYGLEQSRSNGAEEDQYDGVEEHLS